MSRSLAEVDFRAPGFKICSMNYEPKGWHSRGYLPHFDGVEASQFITIRLADSLPQTVLARWQQELEKEQIENADVVLRKRIQRYLDQGYGSGHLKNPNIASLIQNALLYFDSERYKLSAWVVMPNHVHFLATPFAGIAISQIMQSLKNYTARMSNRLLKCKGAFWQQDYFDRYIRDAKHFENTIAYIENNPVKARLCKTPDDWKFSSACWRVKTIEEES